MPSSLRWDFRVLLLVAWGAAVGARGSEPAKTNAGPPGAEVRGTWLTTTATDAIASPANTAATMQTLRQIGLNTVYVECWKDGYTEFPSKVAERFTGVSHKVNPETGPALQRDLMAETLIEAHRNQLIYIAWFEYGFMASLPTTQNELRARRDWIVLDKKGSDVAQNRFVWLNPLHPDAQELLIGIVVEAIKNYDLDGIQLDDRIVWPGLEMGYDDYTRKRYREEMGKEVPEDHLEAEFTAWRQAKVTEFAKRFLREVRAANPKVIVSLAPGPYPWARDKYLCDWVRWAEGGPESNWDEYVPQVYRMDYKAFVPTWQEQVAFMTKAGQLPRLLAGIRLVGDGPDQPRGDPERAAQLIRDTGGQGHVWWFSRGVLEVFPRDLRAFYDVASKGHAAHPRFGPDWRPEPIHLRAVAARPNNWQSDGPVPAGKYRLIARLEGVWQERLQLSTDGEAVEVRVDGSPTAVELLVDRRHPGGSQRIDSDGASTSRATTHAAPRVTPKHGSSSP